jgi:formylglycine-generating enzyme
MTGKPALVLWTTLLAMSAASSGAWLAADHKPKTATYADAPAQRRCGAAASGATQPGMVWVPAGTFTLGADHQYPEEAPASRRHSTGFWMDQTEVTNAQFAAFVTAKGYKTLAERGMRKTHDAHSALVLGSAVFRPHLHQGEVNSAADGWQFVEGANWRHPEGSDSHNAGREQYPVVHIAWEDAQAYANWKGHSLPTEAQFEFAAQGSGRKDVSGAYTANTWQGAFPSRNDATDGYAGAAPVACFVANKLGLYDLIGNVWEWTSSAYYERHDFLQTAAYPEGFDPNQPGEPVAVVKGGSYLCSPDYCMRYRPEARLGQSKGLGTSHIGFRTVLNP